MSPTVFREGPYRIEVAQNHGIPDREVTKILRILEQRHGEVEARWREHRRR